MTAKEMEAKLLEMQEEFRREKDPVKSAAIRAAYKKLHAEWQGAKSQPELSA